jgi:hypothetical protein
MTGGAPRYNIWDDHHDEGMAAADLVSRALVGCFPKTFNAPDGGSVWEGNSDCRATARSTAVISGLGLVR